MNPRSASRAFLLAGLLSLCLMNSCVVIFDDDDDDDDHDHEHDHNTAPTAAVQKTFPARAETAASSVCSLRVKQVN